ncbi:hypothetical protein ACIA5G_39875 [Amycolatopsis sp. NPDC051758]|uniref:hypothetical protein n=1 Tax=Amycolatopsis sp. NPDC051758 TaxID=3363935 RepID=UPI0037A798BC
MSTRTRAATAVFLAATASLAAGCSAGAPTPAAEATASAPAPTTSPSVALPPVTATVPPTTTANPPTGVPSPAPAPPFTADAYVSPVSVATAWMTQWCSSDWRQPRNDNVQRAAALQTSFAAAADLAAGDSEGAYRQMQDMKVSSACDHVTAEVDPEAPAGQNRVFVIVTANRTRMADGRPFQTAPESSTRAVVRQTDGRWLVDVAVDAG